VLYAGKAGTGYTEKVALKLREKLDPLIVRKSPGRLSRSTANKAGPNVRGPSTRIIYIEQPKPEVTGDPQDPSLYKARLKRLKGLSHARKSLRCDPATWMDRDRREHATRDEAHRECSGSTKELPATTQMTSAEECGRRDDTQFVRQADPLAETLVTSTCRMLEPATSTRSP
jgi:hypothetical protein